MDGTGTLFGPFRDALPEQIKATTAVYPSGLALGYEQLEAYLQAAIPDQSDYFLLAESFSGPLAIRHASTKPKHLRGLILCASFAANPMHPAIRACRFPGAAMLFRTALAGALVRALLLDRSAPSELVEQVIFTVRQIPLPVLDRRVREVQTVDVRDLLENLSLPILCLAASRDRLIGSRGLRQIRSGVRDIQVATFDAPHFLLQSRPTETAAAVQHFLRHVSTL